MSDQYPVWVGADPGGAGSFAVAILGAGRSARTVCVDCAYEAVEFVIKHVDRQPAGIGVDAPLWWSSGRSGDRHADQWLRKRYGLTGGQVQATNSLRGAALVQGALFVQLAREAFATVPVTESHPKALLRGVVANSWEAFTARFELANTAATEHERDAIVSAVAAREGFEGRWPNDLSVTRLPREQDPRSYWLAPVHYFWPEQ